MGIGAGTPATEPTDAMHFRWRLRLGGERRHKDGKGEGEDEADDAAPHGGVLQHTPAYSQRVSSGMPFPRWPRILLR